MKKFAVFSGYLGSGKTTTMMALTKYCTEHFAPAAMISNDLGRGVNLADNRLAQLSGVKASEMTDECICYQNENLADRLNSYYDEGCELVISDIPGFGVGALEHVYHGLAEKFPGMFELAPFTVLTEPQTVELLRGGEGGDLRYIYNAQLVEADIIVLNKCDLISETQRQEYRSWLSAAYPSAQVLPISAKTGEGLGALALALREGKASMRRPEIGYGGKAFKRAMGHVSEYYLQYHATVCCDDFDGNDYLMAMAQRIRGAVKASGQEIPHLKLLAWEPEGDFGKVDLLGTERDIAVTRRFTKPCTELAVILNGSADCPKALLDEIVSGAVEAVSAEFRLELVIFKKDFFGMG